MCESNKWDGIQIKSAIYNILHSVYAFGIAMII
jgi:hypothetical protein